MILAFICAAILFTWLVCAGVLMGMGSLVLRTFGSEYSLSGAFWVGLGGVVASLEVYNFFRAIDPVIMLLLACLGLIGLITTRHWFVRHIDALRRSRMSVFLCMATAIGIAFRAAGPCTHYDTGLYGANAVRWILTYPVVPGLANVHFRLGFNSSVFLCVAALEQGPWRGQAHHLFVGFMAAGLLLSCCVPAFSRLFLATSASASDWFRAILLVPAGAWALNGAIVGTNTDFPAAVVGLMGVAIVFRELEHDVSSDANAGADSIVAAVLLSLAVAFKMSLLILAFLAWAVLCVRICVSTAGPSESRLRRLAPCMGLPTIILVPWVVRSVVLSGYPFFPDTLFASSVDWRVPVAMAKWWMEAVEIWARLPGPARLLWWKGAVEAWARTGTMVPMGTLRWVKPWLRSVLHDREGFLLPILFGIGGGLIVLFAVLRRRYCAASGSRAVLWLLVPSASGTIFWFLTAPDPRFGEAALWTMAATVSAFALAFLFSGSGLRSRRIALLAMVALSWWSVGVRSPWRSNVPLLRVDRLLPLPQAELVTRQTASGLTVYMPAAGSQCWDSPLPCTPYFDATLRLRRQDRPNSGFASEGRQELPREWHPTKLANRVGLVPE